MPEGKRLASARSSFVVGSRAGDFSSQQSEKLTVSDEENGFVVREAKEREKKK